MHLKIIKSGIECHWALVVECWIPNFRKGLQSFPLYLYLCFRVFEISVIALSFELPWREVRGMFLGADMVAGPGFRAKALILEGWTPCHMRIDCCTKPFTVLVCFEAWSHPGDAWALTLGSELLLSFSRWCIWVSTWESILLMQILLQGRTNQFLVCSPPTVCNILE